MGRIRLALVSAVLCVPAMAETDLTSYTSSIRSFHEPACRSLSLTSADDEAFVFRVYGCEMTVMQSVPADHPAAEILDEFNRNRLSKTERGPDGVARTFLMSAVLVDARVYDETIKGPPEFACRKEGVLDFMTVETHFDPDGSVHGTGVTISHLQWQDDDWQRRHERTFGVVGVYRGVATAADRHARACPMLEK